MLRPLTSRRRRRPSRQEKSWGTEKNERSWTAVTRGTARPKRAGVGGREEDLDAVLAEPAGEVPLLPEQAANGLRRRATGSATRRAAEDGVVGDRSVEVGDEPVLGRALGVQRRIRLRRYRPVPVGRPWSSRASTPMITRPGLAGRSPGSAGRPRPSRTAGSIRGPAAAATPPAPGSRAPSRCRRRSSPRPGDRPGWRRLPPPLRGPSPREQTTGRPAAMASATGRPKPSSSEGRTRRADAAMRARISRVSR